MSVLLLVNKKGGVRGKERPHTITPSTRAVWLAPRLRVAVLRARGAVLRRRCVRSLLRRRARPVLRFVRRRARPLDRRVRPVGGRRARIDRGCSAYRPRIHARRTHLLRTRVTTRHKCRQRQCPPKLFHSLLCLCFNSARTTSRHPNPIQLGHIPHIPTPTTPPRPRPQQRKNFTSPLSHLPACLPTHRLTRPPLRLPAFASLR